MKIIKYFKNLGDKFYNNFTEFLKTGGGYFILAVALVAIAMLMVSCTVKPIEEKKYDDPNKCVVTEFEVVGSNFTHTNVVEKFTIEGHEYLVFTSKVANPPTVIHSESCPCHSKPVEVKLK